MSEPSFSEAELAKYFKSTTAVYHTKSYPFISPNRPGLSTRGKTAIITGAGKGGIGNSIALSLAKSGISALGLVGRTEATLLATKEVVEKISQDTRVFLYTVDLVDADGIASALQSFVDSTGSKIDILGANAGYMSDLNTVIGSDADDWWRGFEVNIRGNFNLLRAWVPHAQPGGVVVHTSTSAIHGPYMPNFSSYRGSKAGATKVFEIFRHEMAELGNGVRVVQFHPGLIRSTMSFKFAPSTAGFPWDDVELSGDFFNWLVSDEAKFLNGKLVMANWDAEEMLQKKDEIAGDADMYTMNLVGWV
ncbi:hypothetical protein PFICI_10815 [Pestalotiopsis fici W106-1]|uniref:NAD(P)-binding protein n=1 Tax=Pestalotiopsis fici (strain W106-1 / CGMCC3.15140) TaxID=1229662 RepID=W3WVR6_PESFW|nr:uncharacterized protein PFICI_10815 [Pestalotiopsis fici W106-1]ETS76941.1 hypothetical protein PFICI_10815 [Pestalotiopsis fici W106-1]